MLCKNNNEHFISVYVYSRDANYQQTDFRINNDMSMRLRRIALYVVSVITRSLGVGQIRLWWSLQLGLYSKKTSNMCNYGIDVLCFFKENVGQMAFLCWINVYHDETSDALINVLEGLICDFTDASYETKRKNYVYHE